MVGIIDIVMIVVMVCLAWAITSMVLIISKVEKSGTRINFFLIKLFSLRFFRCKWIPAVDFNFNIFMISRIVGGYS